MQILEILKYILPSLVVFATAYFVMKQFIEAEHRYRLLDIQKQNQSANQALVTPLRLQAYERIVLLLERVSPSSLILRENIQGMNAVQLQTTLVKAIRDEFEHNLSQQIYISKQSWDLVKNAKGELVKLINDTAANIDSNASSTELAKAIFELYSNKENPPIEFAIEVIKHEIQELF